MQFAASQYLIESDRPQHLSRSEVDLLGGVGGLLKTGVLRQSVARLSDHHDGDQSQHGEDGPQEEEHQRDPLQHVRVGEVPVAVRPGLVTVGVLHRRDVAGVDEGGLKRDPEERPEPVSTEDEAAHEPSLALREPLLGGPDGRGVDEGEGEAVGRQADDGEDEPELDGEVSHHEPDT